MSVQNLMDILKDIAIAKAMSGMADSGGDTFDSADDSDDDSDIDELDEDEEYSSADSELDEQEDSPDGILVHDLFIQLQKKLREKNDDGLTCAAFTGLKTDIDRFYYIRKLVATANVCELNDLPSPQKSEVIAETFRLAGNKEFRKYQYVRAIKCYNDSIAHATGKKHLALAYANRSSALLNLCEYVDCLKDIDSALENGYPEELKHRLYYRMGKCHRFLKTEPTNETARVAFKRAAEHLTKSKLDGDKKDALRKEYDEKIDGCDVEPWFTETELDEDDDDRSYYPGAHTDPPTLIEQNGTHPGLSAACGVAYNPVRGRHIVAVRDIKPSELVLVEKPYAAVLLPGHLCSSHCNHCFRRLYYQRHLAATVCPQCPIVRYCSVTCRDESWKSYHRYECRILAILHGMGKTGHLVFRTIVVAGLKTFLEDAPECSDSALAGCDADGNYVSSDYNTVHHLHSSVANTSSSTMFSLAAILIIKCLDQLDFFAGVSLKRKKAAIKRVVNHVHKLYRSDHVLAVKELRWKSYNEEDAKWKAVGSGVYPTYALLNHSCQHTTTAVFYDNHVVVAAVRTIKCGEEVSMSYDDLKFTDVPLSRRQLILKLQYGFNCTCVACVNKWPEDPTFDPPIKCPHCQCDTGLVLRPIPVSAPDTNPCPGCGEVVPTREVRDRHEASFELIKEAAGNLFTDQSAKALPGFLQYLPLLEEITVQPCQGFTSCQGCVVRSMQFLANHYCSEVDFGFGARCMEHSENFIEE